MQFLTLHYNHVRVFSPTPADIATDNLLSTRLARLRFLKPENLDVKPEVPADNTWISATEGTLNKD